MCNRYFHRYYLWVSGIWVLCEKQTCQSDVTAWQAVRLILWGANKVSCALGTKKLCKLNKGSYIFMYREYMPHVK